LIRHHDSVRVLECGSLLHYTRIVGDRVP